jgi:hypothetical protein
VRERRSEPEGRRRAAREEIRKEGAVSWRPGAAPGGLLDSKR